MIIIINESVVGLNRFSKKKVPHPHVTSCSYPQSLNNIFSKYYMSCHGHMRHSWVLMGASQEKTFEERDLPAGNSCTVKMARVSARFGLGDSSSVGH